MYIQVKGTHVLADRFHPVRVRICPQRIRDQGRMPVGRGGDGVYGVDDGLLGRVFLDSLGFSFPASSPGSEIVCGGTVCLRRGRHFRERFLFQGPAPGAPVRRHADFESLSRLHDSDIPVDARRNRRSIRDCRNCRDRGRDGRIIYMKEPGVAR